MEYSRSRRQIGLQIVRDQTCHKILEQGIHPPFNYMQLPSPIRCSRLHVSEDSSSTNKSEDSKDPKVTLWYKGGFFFNNPLFIFKTPKSMNSVSLTMTEKGELKLSGLSLSNATFDHLSHYGYLSSNLLIELLAHISSCVIDCCNFLSIFDKSSLYAIYASDHSQLCWNLKSKTIHLTSLVKKCYEL